MLCRLVLSVQSFTELDIFTAVHIAGIVTGEDISLNLNRHAHTTPTSVPLAPRRAPVLLETQGLDSISSIQPKCVVRCGFAGEMLSL